MSKAKENLDRIHLFVGDYYGIKPGDLWNKSKKSYYTANARYVSWALASELLHYSQLMIARQYKYSQSVVSYALIKVDHTPKLKRVVNMLKRDFGEEIAPQPVMTAADFEKLMEIKAGKFQKQVKKNGGKIKIPKRRYARSTK